MSQEQVSERVPSPSQPSDQVGTSQKLSRPLWDSQKVSISIFKSFLILNLKQMKLLLKQESELRISTRSELIRRPTGAIQCPEELKLRSSFLESQLKHSFHLNEQLSNAVSEQFLIIRQLDKNIQERSDEFEYLQSYTASRIAACQDEIASAFNSDKTHKPML